MKPTLKLIGFWSGDRESHESWIDPSKLVAPGCYGDEKSRVVAYLRAGTRINFELGYSFCRIEGGPPDSEMGTCDMTDGTWVWPEGLWVYVDLYDVKLPDEFLIHARNLDYQIPESATKLTLNSVQYDSTFWNRWCSDQKAF